MQVNFSWTLSYSSLDPLKSGMQSRPIKMQRMHSATIFRALRASPFKNAMFPNSDRQKSLWRGRQENKKEKEKKKKPVHVTHLNLSLNFLIWVFVNL